MSFNPERLTVKASQAIQSAQSLAESRSHRILRPLHLLKALLDEERGIMQPLMQQIGVNLGQLHTMVDGELDRLPKLSDDQPTGAGPEAVKVLTAAQQRAQKMGDDYTSTEHLLLALAEVQDQAQRLLKLGYKAPAVIEQLVQADPYCEYRQLGVIDDDGFAAARTGTQNRDWAGHHVRDNFIALGNVLLGEHVLDGMEAGYNEDPDGELEDRLIRAIETGRDAGGQHGGQRGPGRCRGRRG